MIWTIMAAILIKPLTLVLTHNLSVVLLGLNANLTDAEQMLILLMRPLSSDLTNAD